MTILNRIEFDNRHHIPDFFQRDIERLADVRAGLATKLVVGSASVAPSSFFMTDLPESASIAALQLRSSKPMSFDFETTHRPAVVDFVAISLCLGLSGKLSFVDTSDGVRAGSIHVTSDKGVWVQELFDAVPDRWLGDVSADPDTLFKKTSDALKAVQRDRLRFAPTGPNFTKESFAKMFNAFSLIATDEI